jgi:Protein of unknown function (DUF2384)
LPVQGPIYPPTSLQNQDRQPKVVERRTAQLLSKYWCQCNFWEAKRTDANFPARDANSPAQTNRGTLARGTGRTESINERSCELDPLHNLAERFLAQCRRGERPSLRELTDKDPEVAERIRSVFPALLVMEEVGHGGGLTTGLLNAVVDDPQKWLSTPSMQFGGRRPGDLVGTDEENVVS